MLRECLCVHALYTRSTLDRHCVQQPRFGIVGIIPICITSAMCSGEKEMNLCDLMWGCAPEQGPSWEKESP